MYPYLNSQAYRLLAEMPPEAAFTQDQARNPAWGKHVLRGLGGLLVALGQKIQASGLDVQMPYEDAGYPSLDEEVCT